MTNSDVFIFAERGISSLTSGWTDRPQRVTCRGLVSDKAVLNSGEPQGCVLSSVLFSLYTNEMQIRNSTCQLYKYAGDMVLVGLLQQSDTESESVYFLQIGELTKW